MLFDIPKIEYDSDPINDSEFMAFLSSYSTSNVPCPTETVSDTIVPASNKKKNKKSNSLHTRIGKCEHPKHVIYRQEKYTLLKPTASADEKSVLKALPRRGRPPKGSKAVEFERVSYPIVELTVRPLPKRLERVVGKSNIKVCLTCLKRSDTDPDYVTNEKYVGPQKK
ncbi:hypothetical protein INT48_002988 [Thamnidium elegans]|uniref:Uncharacterized protein n=1 Tax=Thamnidium elegans TaxID=101142 RepID=A0A8H7SLS8_9FUNG|nr:hypothetical protein INT48_002988 [Thamnidium elegans]